MTDILMPALSPTMEEGKLAKWLIKAGDTVESGQVIAEIETDKATMEVEAVDEGVVEALLVEAGAEGVKVNTPIARLKVEGEAAAAPQAPPPAAAPAAAPPAAEPKSSPAPQGGSAPAASPLAAKVAQQSGADLSSVKGSGPDGRVVLADLNSALPKAVRADGARILASPLARRIAQQKGVDLSSINGTGPHGRIVRADVEGASPGAAKPAPAAAAPAPKAAPAQAGAPSKSLEQMGIMPGTYTLTPLDGMRKVIARRLTDSFRDVPHFPLNLDLEIDRLLDARARINKAIGGKVSVNDFLIKASAMALKAVPEANASFTPEGIAVHNHADVAVAVAIEGGLITPIIREAENRSIKDISAAMKDLAARARERKLKPEEYQGGTFSLSNLGMFGIKSFSSIINEPQGMILSVGAGEQRPVVHNGQLAVATVMSITLTCDHRVVDGAVGAKWVQAFKTFVEDPVTMLA